MIGRGGVHIDDAWSDGAAAYLGMTTSGFPNLFMLYGPNTNNGSILTMIEYQVEHVIGHLRRMHDEHLAWVDVRPEPMARYNDEVQEAIADVPVWNAGCNGYYRSPSGRIVTQWPFSMTEFHERTATIDRPTTRSLCADIADALDPRAAGPHPASTDLTTSIARDAPARRPPVAPPVRVSGPVAARGRWCSRPST